MQFVVAGVLLAGLLFRTANAAEPADPLQNGPPQSTPHNVVIFVADGLRSRIVTPETAPEMASIRAQGVDFQNSHSLYPTVTTVNASAIATGHQIGDTGDFGNTLWVGAAVSPASPSHFAGLEDDPTLGGMNAHFGGNYLHETSLLAAARAHGFATAVVGKAGPASVQDVTARNGETLIIDDYTGSPDGLPLSADVKAAISAAGFDPHAEDRGLNGSAGDYHMSGVHVANVQQQDWLVGVTTKVVLPRLKASGKPFILVFWSRDPDGTQHGNGDSLNTLSPGINGPTSLAAIRNADNDLRRIRDALKTLGLDQTTDIVITADHGFSTVSRASKTSISNHRTYLDVKPGSLPPGFLAIDLSAALKLPLRDGAGLPVDLKSGLHPRGETEMLGSARHPSVLIADNGGSSLLYLPGPGARILAPKVVAALLKQDYVAGVFVDDALGKIPGALPTSAIGLVGAAVTPRPQIVVSYKSFVMNPCARTDPELCAVEVSESGYTEGQGIHGSFSRANTHNFMAAIGPDFKSGFVDPAPVSNADWAPTLARILGLSMPSKGKLTGRVISEALPGGSTPSFSASVVRSAKAADGFQTVLDAQTVGNEVYLDAAGMPGRVVGLRP
jgi:arylsulfatase A-like enzyme